MNISSSQLFLLGYLGHSDTEADRSNGSTKCDLRTECYSVIKRNGALMDPIAWMHFGTTVSSERNPDSISVERPEQANLGGQEVDQGLLGTGVEDVGRSG